MPIDEARSGRLASACIPASSERTGPDGCIVDAGGWIFRRSWFWCRTGAARRCRNDAMPRKVCGAARQASRCRRARVYSGDTGRRCSGMSWKLAGFCCRGRRSGAPVRAAYAATIATGALFHAFFKAAGRCVCLIHRRTALAVGWGIWLGRRAGGPARGRGRPHEQAARRLSLRASGRAPRRALPPVYLRAPGAGAYVKSCSVCNCRWGDIKVLYPKRNC